VSIQPLYLKVAQVAALLSLSRAEVYRLIDIQALPAIRLGRTLRVSVVALEQFLQARGDIAVSPTIIQERIGHSASAMLETYTHKSVFVPFQTAE